MKSLNFIPKDPRQYSKRGNTGLIVSRLSFGAMTFGKGVGPFATVSKVEEVADRITSTETCHLIVGNIGVISEYD